MYALDDAVLLSRDESFLSLCKAAPEDEYHWFFSGVKMLDHLIREDLPALASVRACRSPANRQNRIEQEHAVFRPAFQIAVARGSIPRSSCSSLKIFTSEGGFCTPFCTEKQSP